VPYAEESAILQFAMLRWQQGRAGSILEAPPKMFEQVARLPGFELARARALAALPHRREDARRCIESTIRSDFETLARNGFWSSILVFTAETVTILDLPDAACLIHELLQPFADQVAFSGNWVAGPIAYGAAVAAAAARNASTDELFEQAVVISDRLEAPLLGARARVAWARVLHRRGRAADQTHAAALCESAIDASVGVGCDQIAAAARTTRRRLHT
jgi:hypothetical protein